MPMYLPPAPPDTTSSLNPGAETFGRLFITQNNVALTSGSLLVSYFTAVRSETVVYANLIIGGVPGTARTLCRYGLWTADNAGALLAQIAATTNDTSLWQFAFADDNKKAWSSAPALVQGQRYALGALFIGGTAPQILGQSASAGSATQNARTPRLGAIISGLSDLPSTAAAGSLTDAGQVGYFQALVA